MLGSEEVVAVNGVSLEVRPGQFVAVVGRSGSGKTTLLNLIAGLDQATSGVVLFEGKDLSQMNEKELTEIRRHKIGFVFQSFGLLPLLSAFENVELPLRISGVRAREREQRARDALEMVGLTRRANHRPYELSGGGAAEGRHRTRRRVRAAPNPGGRAHRRARLQQRAVDLRPLPRDGTGPGHQRRRRHPRLHPAGHGRLRQGDARAAPWWKAPPKPTATGISGANRTYGCELVAGFSVSREPMRVSATVDDRGTPPPNATFRPSPRRNRSAWKR